MMLTGLLLCMVETLSTCRPYLVPRTIVSTIESAPGLSTVEGLNPAYLHGDFDKDGRTDYVVLVRPSTGDVVLLVCWGSGSSETVSPRQIVGGPPEILFDFDGWMVIDSEAPEYYRPPGLKLTRTGDEILVVWAEEGGGLLYRCAGSWHWYDGMDEH